MTTPHATDRGSSSAAVVGILALVILAGAAWIVLGSPMTERTTVIKEKERVEHHHETETKDEKPDIEIELPDIGK